MSIWDYSYFGSALIFIVRICGRPRLVDAPSERLPRFPPLRVPNMRRICLSPGRIFLLAIFVASHMGVAGCNDESRTTGTMVHVSAEEQARLENKAKNYKAGPAKSRAKAKAKMKKVR